MPRWEMKERNIVVILCEITVLISEYGIGLLPKVYWVLYIFIVPVIKIKDSRALSSDIRINIGDYFLFLIDSISWSFCKKLCGPLIECSPLTLLLLDRLS